MAGGSGFARSLLINNKPREGWGQSGTKNESEFANYSDSCSLSSSCGEKPNRTQRPFIMISTEFDLERLLHLCKTTWDVLRKRHHCTTRRHPQAHPDQRHSLTVSYPDHARDSGPRGEGCKAPSTPFITSDKRAQRLDGESPLVPHVHIHCTLSFQKQKIFQRKTSYQQRNSSTITRGRALSVHAKTRKLDHQAGCDIRRIYYLQTILKKSIPFAILLPSAFPSALLRGGKKVCL